LSWHVDFIVAVLLLAASARSVVSVELLLQLADDWCTVVVRCRFVATLLIKCPTQFIGAVNSNTWWTV